MRWALSLFLRFFRYPSLRRRRLKVGHLEPSCGKRQQRCYTKVTKCQPHNLVFIGSEDSPQHLSGVKHPEESLTIPGLTLPLGCFYSSFVTKPRPQAVLDGEGKGESGQPVFPSFSRNLFKSKVSPQATSLPHRHPPAFGLAQTLHPSPRCSQ